MANINIDINIDINILILISQIDFYNLSDTRDHCISFSAISNMRKKDSNYYNINTNFDVTTNKFYMKKNVETSIKIRITPAVCNSTSAKPDWKEDYPLIIFPDIVIIDNPETYCCKLITNNSTSNVSTIPMYNDTYPMSDWIIDMKPGNYTKNFNTPPNAIIQNSSMTEKRKRIEDI